MLKLSSINNGAQTIISTHLFQHLPRYTTAATKTAATTTTTTNLVAEYLVNSLGFSKEEAFLTSSKVSRFKSTENPNSVINFFKSNGLSQTQIKNLVSKSPKLLSCNVDKTLIPKVQAFYDMGFSRGNVVDILSFCPEVCVRSLNDHIIPTVAMLKSLFCVEGEDDGGNEALVTAVKRSHRLLAVDAKRALPSVVSLLESYGLTPCQIRAFALKKTRYLSLGTEILENILIRVEKLGIPRESPMFFHGIIALCSLTEENLNSRMSVYRSYGFSDEDLLMLARKNPYALLISEPRLRKSLEFFMKSVGYKASEIALVPYVLTFSFEKRVSPRYAVWKCVKERSRIKSFVSCLTMTEPRFFEKLVRPFKEEFPELYRDYVKTVRSVPEAEE